MSELSIRDSIAGDLLRVALDAKTGRITTSALLPIAVHAALLVDLALVGRLADGPDAISLDTTPTGFAPADRLLAEMDQHRSWPLERWLRRGHPTPHDLVAELVAGGCWTQEHHAGLPMHAHYVDAEQSLHAHRRSELIAIVRGAARATDPRRAALACVAAASGLLAPELTGVNCQPGVHVLDTCGASRWLVEPAVDYLFDAAADIGAAGVANVKTMLIQGI